MTRKELVLLVLVLSNNFLEERFPNPKRSCREIIVPQENAPEIEKRPVVMGTHV